MLSLTVEFDAPTTDVASDRVDIFANLDDHGIASGDVSYSTPLNASPLPIFPGSVDGPSWGETAWGTLAWGNAVGDPGVLFETLPVHFGEVKIAGKAIDRAGNYQGDAVTLDTLVVNSTPMPPTLFERSTYAAGQQAFTFSRSPQLEAA